jgi:hypothetical protein
MDVNAVLGPVDPQISGMPAGSIVNVLALKRRAMIAGIFTLVAPIAVVVLGVVLVFPNG